MILTELNIVGGHGIPYLAGEPELSVDELARVIDDALDEACAAERFPRPAIVVEPGRANVRGRRRWNERQLRVSLYGAKYTVALVDRHSQAPRR